jgi:thiamine monophosphate synthase
VNQDVDAPLTLTEAPPRLLGLRDTLGLWGNLGIGGITAERVPGLVAVGVHGVAVVGAITDSADPGIATKSLLAALGEPP